MGTVAAPSMAPAGGMTSGENGIPRGHPAAPKKNQERYVSYETPEQTRGSCVSSNSATSWPLISGTRWNTSLSQHVRNSSKLVEIGRAVVMVLAGGAALLLTSCSNDHGPAAGAKEEQL